MDNVARVVAGTRTLLSRQLAPNGVAMTGAIALAPVVYMLNVIAWGAGALRRRRGSSSPKHSFVSPRFSRRHSWRFARWLKSPNRRMLVVQEDGSPIEKAEVRNRADNPQTTGGRDRLSP